MRYHEPPLSCPSFDTAIEQIEKAREINQALRNWGEERNDLLEEALENISTLEAEIRDLKEQLKEYE